MIELKHEIWIQAPPAKVLAVLEDLEAVKNYNPGVAEARYLPGKKAGAGAARECVMKDGSKVRERVLAVDPGRSLTMELYESPWPVEGMQWTTAVQAQGGGTRLTQSLQYRPKGLLGRVLNAVVMRRKMDQNLGRIFEKLKGHMEAGKT